MKITKETIRRALRTFIQSAVAYLTVNMVCINFTDDKADVKSAVIGLLISTVAAGISGAMNLGKVEKKDD